MRPTLVLFAAATFASAIGAQVTTTSPAGFANQEAAKMFFYWGRDRRFQQIDQTHLGNPMVLRGIAFRRDATGGGSQSGARTLSLEVKIGPGSLRIVHGTAARNLSSGTVTVFPRAAVQFPDWSQPPASPPAAFDFTVPLAAPLAYDGQRGLLIDLAVTSSSNSNFVTMDLERYTPALGIPRSIGTGCVATGQTGAFQNSLLLDNSGATMGSFAMRLTLYGHRAPANNPVLANLDVAQTQISLPGLCADIRVMPLIQLNLGNSMANGRVPVISFALPHSPSWEGVAFYSQLFALDPGQSGIPLTVSNAQECVMPITSAGASMQCCYLWEEPTGEGAALPLYGGGAVIGLIR